MTMENYLSQAGIAQKLAERYTEYGPSHDQSLYYPYEPAPSSPGHVAPFKHHFSSGTGHKNNAAMSALTLLAFLFFLHILQSCLKDHMTAMSTPQVMVLTGGREGEENIAKHSYSKEDKTGEIENKKNKNAASNADEKHFSKITTSENRKSNIRNNYPAYFEKSTTN